MKNKRDHIDDLITHTTQNLLKGHSINILAINPLHERARKLIDDYGAISSACKAAFQEFLANGQIKVSGRL